MDQQEVFHLRADLFPLKIHLFLLLHLFLRVLGKFRCLDVPRGIVAQEWLFLPMLSLNLHFTLDHTGHEFGADGVRHPVAAGRATNKRIHAVFLPAGVGQRRRRRQRGAARTVQSHAGRLQQRVTGEISNSAV